MSFSREVKNELALQESRARHCCLAELSAIISMCGYVLIDTKERYKLKIQTENLAVARKGFTLIEKTFNIVTENSTRKSKKKANITYILMVINHIDTIRILEAVKLIEEYEVQMKPHMLANNMIVRLTCCKRAFIRGAFLVAGAVSPPDKAYHFEIGYAVKEKAEQLRLMINSFGLDAKIVQRKRTYVVYLKEGAQVVDMLNIMGAHKALMSFENERIVKDVRNTVNRKVNCETANMQKTVSAAVKQIEDIKYIEEVVGLEKLPDNLKEAAMVRLEYPDVPLKELGEFMNPSIGKSGINHRLRKLSEISEKLKESKEAYYG